MKDLLLSPSDTCLADRHAAGRIGARTARHGRAAIHRAVDTGGALAKRAALKLHLLPQRAQVAARRGSR